MIFFVVHDLFLSNSGPCLLGILIYQVDAFTNCPFSGNPACVCLLKEKVTDQWMQNIAAEMNLSETAFLLPEGDEYHLRWFTPLLEVDLCGHATLAAAHVLWEVGLLSADQSARFNTRSGLLTAEKTGDWIELDFPAEPAEMQASVPDALSRALSLKPGDNVGKNRFDYLVVLDSEKQVRSLQPDLALIKTLPARGVIVTAAASSGNYDFVSRFFAPASGINEDPVTGSAHCCLGPYWQKRLARNSLLAYQASARGGIIRLRLLENRVILGGQAVTVFSGELRKQRHSRKAGNPEGE